LQVLEEKVNIFAKAQPYSSVHQNVSDNTLRTINCLRMHLSLLCYSTNLRQNAFCTYWVSKGTQYNWNIQFSIFNFCYLHLPGNILLYQRFHDLDTYFWILK